MSSFVLRNNARALGSFRNAVMSPTQSVPLKLFTMGKTSMLVSSAFRKGITRSSTARARLF